MPLQQLIRPETLLELAVNHRTEILHFVLLSNEETRA